MTTRFGPKLRRDYTESMDDIALPSTRARFRVHLARWLEAYGRQDWMRGVIGEFDETSLDLPDAALEACMAAFAIPGLVTDADGDGRYRLPRRACELKLFTEGPIGPRRRLRLACDSVLTLGFAAWLVEHEWPPDMLGAESPGWGFDLVAHAGPPPAPVVLLGEAKSSLAELAALQRVLDACLAAGAAVTPRDRRERSLVKKWDELVATPSARWLVVLAPSTTQAYAIERRAGAITALSPVALAALRYSLH